MSGRREQAARVIHDRGCEQWLRGGCHKPNGSDYALADAVLAALGDADTAQADALGGILSEIRGERGRQDAKWGEQSHEPSVWLAILTEEVGEFAEAVLHALAQPGDERNHTHSEDMRTEAIQIAAVAVQIVEYLDRAVVGDRAAAEGRETEQRTEGDPDADQTERRRDMERGDADSVYRMEGTPGAEVSEVGLAAAGAPSEEVGRALARLADAALSDDACEGDHGGGR